MRVLTQFCLVVSVCFVEVHYFLKTSQIETTLFQVLISGTVPMKPPDSELGHALVVVSKGQTRPFGGLDHSFTSCSQPHCLSFFLQRSASSASLLQVQDET